eukprot:Skav200347  [mRNA]  locus=scaffold852:25374:27448:+ [translate_table: standard]
MDDDAPIAKLSGVDFGQLLPQASWAVDSPVFGGSEGHVDFAEDFPDESPAGLQHVLIEDECSVEPGEGTGMLEQSAQDLDVKTSSQAIQVSLDSLPVEKPLFFWESNPFLAAVMGNAPAQFGTFPDVKRPLVPVAVFDGQPLPAVDNHRKAKCARVESKLGLCQKSLRHVEPEDEISKRKSVISDWSSLVAIDIFAFSIGNLLSEDGGEVSHDAILNTVRACLASKATSTISKRFYALNRYVKYCAQRGMEVLPLKESSLFQYLQHLNQDPSTAASAGRSFMEAVRFAGGVLGLHGDVYELGTQRLNGLAIELASKAGPIFQASPLTVAQVMQLEKMLVATDNLQDKHVLGCLLVLLYSCGRVSDGQRVTQIILDVDMEKVEAESLDVQGYIELSVLGSKTARGDKLKRTFLPLVAPIFSMSSVPWFHAWIQAREELWDLKSLASCRGPSSIAVTLLSWAGKFGVPLPLRRLLGHHVDPGSRSAETYCRDAMSPAIRAMEEVLKSIKRGSFLPDATRSGRFTRASGSDNAAGDVLLRELAEEDQEDNISGSESGSECSDVEPVVGGVDDSVALWDLADPSVRPDFEALPPNCHVYRNLASGMQHYRKGAGDKFLCGRRLTERYVAYSGKPVIGVTLCEQCANSHGVRAEV